MIENERVRRRSPGSLRTAVLAALIEQPGHGYDLATRLGRRMGPALEVDPRRVYEVLEQLAKDGLVSSEEERTDEAPSGWRRVYTATLLGHETHMGWLREREPVPLARADIHALVAFSTPEHAPELLSKLDEYELDCIEMQERAVGTDVRPVSWRGRMLSMTRAATSEQLAAEIRWIKMTRREIEEYRAEAQ